MPREKQSPWELTACNQFSQCFFHLFFVIKLFMSLSGSQGKFCFDALRLWGHYSQSGKNESHSCPREAEFSCTGGRATGDSERVAPHL